MNIHVLARINAGYLIFVLKVTFLKHQAKVKHLINKLLFKKLK